MAIIAFDQFCTHVRASAPAGILGIDYGDRRIGVAISDPGLMVATPLGVITETKFTKIAESLVRMIDKRTIGGIILGLPVNMDGTEGSRCDIVRSFADNLNRYLKEKNQETTISYWDERLSTKAMERFLIQELDTTRKKRQQQIDQLAAAYILEGALARLRNPEIA